MIDLPPSRFHALYTDAMRLRAEDRLSQLAIVNRALAGGDGYSELQQMLQAEIRALSDSQL